MIRLRINICDICVICATLEKQFAEPILQGYLGGIFTCSKNC